MIPALQSIPVLDIVTTMLFACLFVHGVCTINFMTKRTPWPRRLGYILFTIGSFAAAIAPIYGMGHLYAANLLIGCGMLLTQGYTTVRRWVVNTRRLMYISD